MTSTYKRVRISMFAKSVAQNASASSCMIWGKQLPFLFWASDGFSRKLSGSEQNIDERIHYIQTVAVCHDSANKPGLWFVILTLCNCACNSNPTHRHVIFWNFECSIILL